MKRLIILLGFLLITAKVEAQQTATYGTLVTSLNTSSTGAVTGTTWAVPSSYAALIQWTVVADGSALSVNLMCSLDNSSYFVVDTQTTATGGTKQFGFTACKFVRIDAVSRTGGTATVGTLVTSRGFITTSSAGSLSSLNLSGNLTFSSTGRILNTDGSIGAPSYSFVNGTSTGIMRNTVSLGPVLVAAGNVFLTADAGAGTRAVVNELGWSNGANLGTGNVLSDIILPRDAPNTLALRNGTNAQAFRVYNTFTDVSNYERGFMRWSGNLFQIGNEQGGTGTGRIFELYGAAGIRFFTNGTNAWTMNSAGHLIAVTDNTYDIGASGATRPRVGYFGTSVTAPFHNGNTSSIIASGGTIAPTGNIHHISGTAAIATITVPAGCTPTCQITLIPDGIFTTTTAGNISLASTAVVNKALIMTWDGTKWNPSY